jgi:hypothetical protein
MNIKQELQHLNSKLDKSSRKLAAAKKRGDQVIVLQFKAEIELLIVVHPLTSLGRELTIEKVTGFAPKKF